MLITDHWFYVAAIPALLITGISKGGFAGAAGGLAVPMMALAISPVQAAAITLPILCAMDVLGLWAYRRIWDRHNILLLTPFAVLGIVLGAFTFEYLSDDAVRLIVGSIALAFGLYRVLGVASAAPSRASAPVGALCGAMSGFTSFVAHAGAPPLQIYLLPQRLDKTVYAGTTVVFFFIVNYVKLIPYALIGQFSTENLATSLALLPVAPLGIWLGIKLHRIVPEKPFYAISYALLIATGAKLVWDGAVGWLGSPF